MSHSSAADFDEELMRAVDMLRAMPIPKLSRPVGEAGPTRAERARAVAQLLADLTADAEGRPRRVVPDVGDPAVGDQLAVTGRDLMRAQVDAEVVAGAADRLRSLRLQI